MFTTLSQKLGFSHKLGVLFSISDQVTKDDNELFIRNKNTADTQTNSDSLIMDQIRRQAEFMAMDLISTFGDENARKPPNKYCKTLRRTVKEISFRHYLVFKGIVNRLDPEDDDNALKTFVIVADELFDEGQVNWGRIVTVYAFAVHFAKYLASNTKNDQSDQNLVDNKEMSALVEEKFATFVGKYVASKLGQWILDHGGWDAFVEHFPDNAEFETKLWKVGLVAAFGLGALATVVASK